MQNQIEGECKCGVFDYYDDLGRWVGSLPGADYCPHCGYHLGSDGIARRTVVLPEEPVVVFRPPDGDEYYTPDSGGECWGYPRFFVIPAPQGGADENTV